MCVVGTISRWPLYGATCFHGHLRGVPDGLPTRPFEEEYDQLDVRHSRIPVLVAICRTELRFLSPVRRSTLFVIALSDIKTVEVSLLHVLFLLLLAAYSSFSRLSRLSGGSFVETR